MIIVSQEDQKSVVLKFVKYRIENSKYKKDVPYWSNIYTKLDLGGTLDENTKFTLKLAIKSHVMNYACKVDSDLNALAILLVAINDYLR
ncbi:hypothetical protein [Bacillus phage YungSlug]|nr:hypothetical protein [Bacillus phage YungSlug]